MITASKEEKQKIYFSNYFPSNLIYRWLSYSKPFFARYNSSPTDENHYHELEYFHCREFCFNVGNDVFVRFKSYSSDVELNAALTNFAPNRIEIGAVYDKPITQQTRAIGLKITEKEFFVDIDMSDYADVRVCCGNEAKICPLCWPFMAAAVKIIDLTLREDFGFSKILWVFSGRRGLHCWVCDERARVLTKDQRFSLAEYLRVFKGNESNAALVDFPLIEDFQGEGFSSPEERSSLLEGLVSPSLLLGGLSDYRKRSGPSHAGTKAVVQEEQFVLHPMHARSFWICQEYFFLIYLMPNIFFCTESMVQRLLEIVAVKGSKKLGEEMQKVIAAAREELSKDLKIWERCLEVVEKSVEDPWRVFGPVFVSFVYPRIDVEVSRQLNHLLKSPFSVHPSTGKICIPLEPSSIDDFSVVENCPTLDEIIDLDSTKKRKEARFAKALEFFENGFLKQLEDDARKAYMNKKKEASVRKPVII